VNTEVRKFLKKCDHFRIGDINESTAFSGRDLSPALELLGACKWNYYEPGGGQKSLDWRAGDALHAQDSHAVNIQVEILSSLAALVALIRSPGAGWYYDQGASLFRVNGMTRFGLINRFDDQLRSDVNNTVGQTQQFLRQTLRSDGSETFGCGAAYFKRPTLGRRCDSGWFY
jgi:hypothetical protein